MVKVKRLKARRKEQSERLQSGGGLDRGTEDKVWILKKRETRNTTLNVGENKENEQ